MRWSDLDLKAGTLTVNQSLERIKGKVTFKAPKTNKPALYHFARRYCAGLQEHRVGQAERIN